MANNYQPTTAASVIMGAMSTPIQSTPPLLSTPPPFTSYSHYPVTTTQFLNTYTKTPATTSSLNTIQNTGSNLPPYSNISTPYMQDQNKRLSYQPGPSSAAYQLDKAPSIGIINSSLSNLSISNANPPNIPNSNLGSYPSAGTGYQRSPYGISSTPTYPTSSVTSSNVNNLNPSRTPLSSLPTGNFSGVAPYSATSLPYSNTSPSYLPTSASNPVNPISKANSPINPPLTTNLGNISSYPTSTTNTSGYKGSLSTQSNFPSTTPNYNVSSNFTTNTASLSKTHTPISGPTSSNLSNISTYSTNQNSNLLSNRSSVPSINNSNLQQNFNYNPPTSLGSQSGYSYQPNTPSPTSLNQTTSTPPVVNKINSPTIASFQNNLYSSNISPSSSLTTPSNVNNQYMSDSRQFNSSYPQSTNYNQNYLFDEQKRQLEETNRRLEEQIRLKQIEEEKIKKQIEEDHRRALEEENRRKIEEENRRKRLEEERIRKQIEQENIRKLEEENRRRIEEEQRRRMEEERIRREVQEQVQREQERLQRENQERLRIEEERIRKELTDKLRAEEEKLRLLHLQNLAKEEEAKRMREENERKQKEIERMWQEREKKWQEEEERRRMKEEEDRKMREEQERKLREDLDRIERERKELERVEKARIEQERIEREKREREKEENSWKLRSNDIFYSDLIGKGAFGSVFKGKLHGKDVAIKKLLSQHLKQEVLDEFTKETKILSQLRHPNILLFIGACFQPGNLAIVTELMSNGSLQDLLFTKQVNISYKQRLKILKDIVLGMNWLHSLNPPLLHRDLKSGNILLDENLRAKVSDFGFTSVKSLDEEGEKIEGLVGSPFYMAPEVLLEKPFDTKADVYSFSIIMWETLANEEPYHGVFDSFEELTEGITVDDMRPNIPDWFPPGVTQLIKMCWERDPQKRPSFNDILSQGWFDHFLVDYFLFDPISSNFWKTFFLEKDSARWDEFQTALLTYYQISTNEQLAAFQNKLQITKMLISKQNNSGIFEVLIENFASLSDWFGPFSNPIDLVEKPFNMLSNLWYHATSDQINAENVLKSTAIPKSWLVRQGSILADHDKLREFFISVLDDNRSVNHSVAYQTQDGILYFENQPYENWASLINANQLNLKLNIATPCFESPFKNFFITK